MPLNTSDANVTEADLADAGIEVVNLVATIELLQELDLNWIDEKMPFSEYHPERSAFLIYRPNGLDTTALIPTNGTVSIVGAKSKDQLAEATENILTQLSTLGVPIDPTPDEVTVQNVVTSSDFDVELELATVATGLGLESCEYEPEQFPGLVYRVENGTTGLIFRTGKCLITGANDYEHVFESARIIRQELNSIGIELD